MEDARANDNLSQKRQMWEQRWQSKDLSEFAWFSEEPPPELLELLTKPSLPQGAALDLGCGAGVVTARLAHSFRPAVGIDIAIAAVAEAKRKAEHRGAEPTFVAAAAPILPFRSSRFALVFDRGCLQAIPRRLWPAYFSEVERLLVPGGMLQLFCSRARRVGGVVGKRGARMLVRRLKGRRRPEGLSESVLLGLAQPRLTALDVRASSFVTAAGRQRDALYGLFVKAR
jgi:SAM-dependent methyltransferase